MSGCKGDFMKKISIMLAVLLVFGLDFAVGQNNSNSLIGTWTGKTLLGDASLTFAADNTVTMSMMEDEVTASGTYVVRGNNITMNFTMGGLIPKNILRAQRNGNNLIIDDAVYTKSTQPSGPQTAVEYMRRGSEYFKKGDYDQAIADFTQVIRLAPNEDSGYYIRGVVYNEKGDFDRAIADLTQAIKLDPNRAGIYEYRGVAYNKKGDFDRAIADFTQAIRLDPNEADFYKYRGAAYMGKGDYDRAIADYTQLIKLNPNYDVWYYNRGVAYNEKGDYDRAIADYTQAIKLDPNDADYYYVRGAVYLARKDYNRAITDFEAALRIDSNNTEAKNGLDEARRLRGSKR
jgi:tetratricopeptide (TPR) repeat protein